MEDARRIIYMSHCTKHMCNVMKDPRKKLRHNL